MSKHTPGPWKNDLHAYNLINSVSVNIRIYVPAPTQERPHNYNWIGDVKGGHVGPRTIDEIVANVNLITAAPDLLEALEKISRDASEMPYIKEIATKAIAKAKGDKS